MYQSYVFRSHRCHEGSSSSRNGISMQQLKAVKVNDTTDVPLQTKGKTVIQAKIQDIACQNQSIREGHYEKDLVVLQATKDDLGQPSIYDYLQPYERKDEIQVCVVGCGPSGLALAANLAQQGIYTVLVGPDAPFVNNYGVWVDEFEEMGLKDTLSRTWQQTICYFGDGERKDLNRAYGQVDRGLLRTALLDQCGKAGVKYYEGKVEDVDDSQEGAVLLKLKNDESLSPRLTVLATGQLAGRFLKYESDAPVVAAQTAYGIEAEVEGYEDAFDADSMLFMDYRRHHTGLWPGTALQYQPGAHPNGSPTLSARGEVPSFLYAMPLAPGRVFLEETCLVARPALPFALLKRRLTRRLDALGIKVKHIHEEEWSYIPVGGPLPEAGQRVTAFGAAANLVHPATGYSITRSLQEAPGLAKEIANALRRDVPPEHVAIDTWNKLWPTEKRKQASFHVFGMELFTRMDLDLLADFFQTFFKLPQFYWRGFLASQLSSNQLLVFAFLCFVMASNRIRFMLMMHLFQDPSGSYLLKYYTADIKAWLQKTTEEMQQTSESPTKK